MATLYHVPTSRSLRVLWTLEEIGATVEVKSLGVRPRLQEPEYLAINPAGTRGPSEPQCQEGLGSWRSAQGRSTALAILP